MIVNPLLHETEYFFRDLLSCVEQGLFLVILPVESQVEHSNSLPEVAELGASRVDDPHYFVGHDKFQVLEQTTKSRVKTELDFMKPGGLYMLLHEFVVCLPERPIHRR